MREPEKRRFFSEVRHALTLIIPNPESLPAAHQVAPDRKKPKQRGASGGIGSIGIKDSRNQGVKESRNKGIFASRNKKIRESMHPGMQEARNQGIKESRNQ